MCLHKSIYFVYLYIIYMKNQNGEHIEKTAITNSFVSFSVFGHNARLSNPFFLFIRHVCKCVCVCGVRCVDCRNRKRNTNTNK